MNFLHNHNQHTTRPAPFLAQLLAVFALLAWGVSVARASDHFDWDRGDQGWHFLYGYNRGIGDLVPWLGRGGVGDSGYVVSPLSELQPWDATGPTNYYPLIAYYTNNCNSSVNPIDLTRPMEVKVWLNIQPFPPEDGSAGIPPAVLNGRLVFFIGEHLTNPTENRFYYYDANGQWLQVPRNPGWYPASIIIEPSTNKWTRLHSNESAPQFPPAELFRNPQQWGFCMVGATQPPENVLGFDALSLTPIELSPAPGQFQFDCGSQGWNYYYKWNRGVGDRLPWKGGDGDPDHGSTRGFVYSPLGELVRWPEDPQSGAPAYFPFITYSWLNPIRLDVERTELTYYLHSRPIASVPSADLRGGELHFFVGQFNSMSNYAFYVFNTPVAIPVGEAWTAGALTLSTNASDWTLLAGRVGPEEVFPPLLEILQLPQQYGFCVKDTADPLANYLGMDTLVIPRLSRPDLRIERVGSEREGEKPTRIRIICKDLYWWPDPIGVTSDILSPFLPVTGSALWEEFGPDAEVRVFQPTDPAGAPGLWTTEIEWTPQEEKKTKIRIYIIQRPLEP